MSLEAFQLNGKNALVTGSHRGLGAAIAVALAKAGANVGCHGRDAKPGAACEEIRVTGRKTFYFSADLGDPKSYAGLIEKTIGEFGSIDILVNNAGIYEVGPLEQITPEHYRKIFDVNVLGLLLTTKEAVAHFNPNGGSIVNISSVVVDGVPGLTVYSATKGAVDTITSSLAKELGPKKIRVNSLNPGMIETEGAHAAGFIGSDFQKAAEARTPLGRIGQPQDVATAAAFLASDDSGWINGQAIYASGGFTL